MDIDPNKSFKISIGWNDLIIGEEYVRDTFDCVSENDTIFLAKAFGQVVHLQNRPKDPLFRTISLGISGIQNSGKTIFSNGLANTFNDLTIKQTTAKNQFFGESLSFGTVCRADLGYCDSSFILYEYRYRTNRPDNYQGLDIIEHAAKSPVRFHTIAAISPTKDNDNTRCIEMFSMPELAETDGYKQFLSDAAHLRHN